MTRDERAVWTAAFGAVAVLHGPSVAANAAYRAVSYLRAPLPTPLEGSPLTNLPCAEAVAMFDEMRSQRD